MKIKVNTKQLLKILTSAATIANGNHILPIHKYVLLQADGNKLRATGSSEGAEVSRFITIDEESEFVVCALCSVLLGTIKLIKQEEITLEVKERANKSKYLFIKAGKGSYKIEVTGHNEFITLKMKEATSSFKTLGSELFDKIIRASVCADTKDVREFLNGANIVADGGLCTVSGFSNATGTNQFVKVDGEFEPTLIPKESCMLLNGIKFDGESTITSDGKTLMIDNGSIKFTTRLINQKFPDTSAIWKQQQEWFFSTKKEQLIDAVNRILNFSSKNDHMILLEFKGDELSISAQDDSQHNEALEVVDLETNNNQEVVIALNGILLTQALSHIDADSVRIYTEAENKPMFIQKNSNSYDQKWIINPVLRAKALEERQEVANKKKAAIAKKGAK